MRPKHVRKWQFFIANMYTLSGEVLWSSGVGARVVAPALSGEVPRSTNAGPKKSRWLLLAADFYALVLEGGGQWAG